MRRSRAKRRSTAQPMRRRASPLTLPLRGSRLSPRCGERVGVRVALVERLELAKDRLRRSRRRLPPRARRSPCLGDEQRVRRGAPGAAAASDSFTSTSRAKARSAGALGRSCIPGSSAELAASRSRARIRWRAARSTPDRGCARRRTCSGRSAAAQSPPSARSPAPPRSGPAAGRSPAGLALVAAIERRAIGDPAGFAVEPGKPPALAAEPADILVRVAPTGEFPIEDRGQRRAIEQVIAGAEIVMAQHRLGGRRACASRASACPIRAPAGCGMTVEIGAKLGDLAGRRRPRHRAPERPGRGVADGSCGSGRARGRAARQSRAAPDRAPRRG